MVSFTSKSILSVLAVSYLSLSVAAQGTQFITGDCTADADCASACCGFNTGKCAGAVVAQERDGGCGFGDATPNSAAADALTGGGDAAAADTGAAASQNDGAAAANNGDAAAAGGDAAGAAAGGQGTQFITGDCASDADCASACCGFNSGKCAGPAVAQERDGGCGFGDAQPNSDAADALQARALEIFGKLYA